MLSFIDAIKVKGRGMKRGEIFTDFKNNRKKGEKDFSPIGFIINDKF